MMLKEVPDTSYRKGQRAVGGKISGKNEVGGYLTDFICGRLEEYYRALRLYRNTWVYVQKKKKHPSESILQ